MHIVRAVLVVVLLLTSSVGSVVGFQEDTSVSGRPEFTAYIPENRIAPGTDGTVSLFLVNTGKILVSGADEFEQLVQTARATTVSVTAPESNPISIRTGTTPVGTLPEGVAGPYPIRVVVPDDTTPGTYELTVTVEFEHTAKVITSPDGSVRFTERSRTEELPVTVVVEDQAQFSIRTVESAVAVGGTGTVTLDVTNDGTEPARDATLLVQSADPELTFGAGAASAENFLGTLAPGATTRVTVRAGLATDALVRNYAATATVQYKDAAGLEQQSGTTSLGIQPQSGQPFSIENVTSTLRVGGDGTVSGSVVNTGGVAVTDVVVMLEPVAPPLVAQNTAIPVGDLEPGERAAFEYTVAVVPNATAGTRRLSATVEYRSPAGKQVTAPFSLAIPVAQKRDQFSVTPVNATFEVDSSGILVVRLTNEGDTQVTDVTAQLQPVEPLSSADATTFVSRLDAGESATLRFDLDVSDDAIPKTQVATLALSYESATRTARVESQPIPVTVVAGEPQSIPVEAVGLVVVAVVVASVWWYRRR
ncbi:MULTISPECIES: COG1361 S-layer family protein [unclassified Haladaptatus]|uniref:COG1361 S-layer family protein n=1 Tax=unclassified Haladaptatus TaxID=2622732 RepID=UPI0023E8122B|nr:MULTISPECIES: COG1361 S-layer family protein [unclassified Haladaptatus]